MNLAGSIGRHLIAVSVIWVLTLGLCQTAGAEVTRSGVLHATVTDDFRTGQSTTRYTLRSGRQVTALRPTELAAEPGDRVVVTGELRDDRLVGAVEATNANPAAALAPGPRKVAVLLLTFPGDSQAPWPAAEIRSKVFTAANSANAFYEEESYGGISLTGKLEEEGDVFGWLSLEAPIAGCPFDTWKAEADEAAAGAGIDLTGYQHLVYMFPHRGSCSWSGTASNDWSMINGNQGTHVIIHELGHNLGLLHAGSWRCTAGGVRVQISDTCSSIEYGDPFDAMGNIAPRHNSGWNLAKLGILVPGNVETVEASGTYSVQSALDPTTEPTVLRIPRKRALNGSVSSWYYLEVRKKGGVFESVADLSTTGVSIRATAADSPQTLLLDANPATTGFHDAPLAAGQTFDGGPVRVTTLAAGEGAATVSVELDEAPPTAPTALTAAPGFEEVELHWEASSDDFGIHRYVVFRDGNQVGASESTSFLDSPVPVGDYEYVVYAEDVSGNRSAASDPATATVEPDEEPPVAPTDLTAITGPEGVELRWEASTDDFGVRRYVVLRNGSEIGSSAGTGFLDSFSSAGEHQYVVYAEDKAGNRSVASEPMPATVPETFGPTCTGGFCRVTYRHAGATANWTVPPGVDKAEFSVEGAQGGYDDNPTALSSRGGRVVATLGSLSPTDEVIVSVGGAGETFAEGGAGGFGGGGDGVLGGGGGGYSSVTLDSTLMLLAGGGGGWGGRGLDSITEGNPGGGGGGRGGELGTPGSSGVAIEMDGAMLRGGGGGARGDGDGMGGTGGEVTGTSSCPGGASPGASGAPGGSFAGGGGEPGAGGGGGGGYVGGGQGGGGAGDACGNRAGSGGGGGGSSFAAPGVSATFTGGIRRGYGQVSIAYSNPVTAGDRSYSVLPDQELTVPLSSGVLSAAPGPSGVPLTASVDTPPAHGSLALDGDGSFTYAPTPGYAGADSFAYRATDPSGNYATGEVTLWVAAAPLALITAPPGGGTYVLEQVVPAAFACSEGAGGTGIVSCDDSTGSKTKSGGVGLLDTSTVGTHAYTVTAASKSGLTGSASVSYSVVRGPEVPADPKDPPRDPEDPPAEIDLSLAVERKSLRELLRNGEIVVLTKVNVASRLMLTGDAKLKGRPVAVFKRKMIRFSGPGEKKVTLVLSRNGRKAFRHLSKLRLVIGGQATAAAGEKAKRRVAVTLR